MLRIEEPIYFYCLLILVFIAGVAFYYRNYSAQLYTYFAHPRDVFHRLHRAMTQRFIFFLSGLGLCLLALTNPQYGFRKEKVQRQSADIYIGLDISRSMLAEDLSPSRLERAKKIAERIILQLKSERIGLIFFAGEAYLQAPLTTDYRTAAVFLRNAEVDQAGLQGTAIADAIRLAARREDETDTQQRLLILITDGEDHEGEAADAAAEALNAGVAVFAIGVGTEDGAFIPTNHGNQSEYLRDETGQPVRSRLQPGDLRQIAEAGGGFYYDHTVGRELYKSITEKVNRLERRNFEKTMFTARESYYQWLLLPGLILLCLSYISRPRLTKTN